MTLHRPGNVDKPETLSQILDVLVETSRQLPLVFPIHPRTKQRIGSFGLQERIDAAPGVLQLPPLGYLDFLSLTSQAKVIVTDSGGLQEESTVLGIPCLTLRPNTERPITIEGGTSTLVGNDPKKLRLCLHAVLDGTYKHGRCPELWDGRAAQTDCCGSCKRDLHTCYGSVPEGTCVPDSGDNNVNICMIVDTDMSHDARVWKEAKTLAREAHQVTVLAAHNDALDGEETSDGVRLIRVVPSPLKSHRGGASAGSPMQILGPKGLCQSYGVRRS